jgi:spore coat protein U-like protein
VKRARVAFVFAAALALVCSAPQASFAAPACIVTNVAALAFGSIYAADEAQDGRASFVVNCSRTQTVTISLVYSHHMKSRDGTGLTYDLYSAPNHASVWGSGGDGASVSATVPAGRPLTLFIYARIPAGQRPVAGDFTDDVEIQTLAF